MKEVGNYNKFPKGFELPKLKKGEKAVFRLTDELVQIDPTDPQKKKRLFPLLVQVPPTDTILTDDGPVLIGLVKRVDKDGIPQDCDYLEFELGQGEPGKFTLKGDSVIDVAKYPYAKLTDHNGSKPGRDESKKIYFYEVNEDADAQKVVNDIDEEVEALYFIKGLSPAKLKEHAQSFGAPVWNETDTPAIRKQKLQQEARRDPKKFNRIINNSDETSIKAILQTAFDKGVIKYDVEQNKVVWAKGGTIATLARVEGSNWLDNMSDWVKSHKNGQTTFDNIKKLLKEEPSSNA